MYLESQFENFKEAPIVHFNAFNFKFWPQDREQLAVFGTDEIQGLVNHFKEQLSEEECNKIPQEWVALKTYVVHFRGLPLL